MAYLIDTNVLSELRRPQPDASVVAWVAARPPATLFISVLTLAELKKGIARLPPSARKTALADWLDVELPAYFLGRILAVDVPVALRWGELVAAAGRPLPAIDAMLAATASVHGLSLVTRNVRDFEGLGVVVIDPWEADHESG